MASAPYLDDIESSGLTSLPNELRKNFTLMKDLHSKSQKLMTDIDKMADSYMSNIKKNSVDKNKKTMAIIESKFEAAKELSDDTVQVSIQNYSLVDAQIRKLDLVISRFEEQMKLKAAVHETVLKAKRNLDLKKGGSKSVSADTDPSNLANVEDNVAVDISSLSGALLGTGRAHSAFAAMPIDPNEPKFCLCNQVSFGQMVACDNPDCDIEWFHFACVSLITKPKGKWFCPKCGKGKKKK